MGNKVTEINRRVVDRFSSNPKYKIVMVGQPNAGKTTIFYKLRLGEIIASVPIVGLSLESLESKSNFVIYSWDTLPCDYMRNYWNPYLQNAHVLIYVIDSTDTQRIADSRIDLQKLVSNTALKDTCMIILANKADSTQPRLSANAVEVDLNLGELTDRKWKIFETAGLTGEGLRHVQQQITKWWPKINFDV